MPTYTSSEAVAAYLEAINSAEYLPTPEAAADALIERAEDDIDRILSPQLERDATTGRKLALADLTDAQVAALSRATAAQVAFRLEAGEDELLAADALSAAGGITFGPTPRPPSAAAIEHLSGYGFKWRSGSVAAPAESEGE